MLLNNGWNSDIHTDEAERGSSLMDTLSCVWEWEKCLTIDHVSDIVIINLMGIELSEKKYNWVFKSWLNWNHRLATDMRWQKLMIAFCKNQFI